MEKEHFLLQNKRISLFFCLDQHTDQLEDWWYDA